MGLLRSVKISSSLRYPLSEDVLALLNAVSGLPFALDQLATLPVNEYCRQRRISLWRVLQAWREGALEGVCYQGCGKGICALEIALDAQCERHQPILNGDLVLSEVARHLKISIGSIRHLRDADYLTQVRQLNPDTNHLKNYITWSSIRCFEKTYITLANSHLSDKLNRFILLEKLTARG